MTKRVLITGAAGFVGGHLAASLAGAPDVELLLVDSFGRGRKDEFLDQICARPGVTFAQCDLRDSSALDEIEGTFSEVYHLAAIVGVKHCLSRPAEVLDVNIRSTLNVLDFVERRACGKLMFSSSSEIYAGGFELGALPIPTPEDVPTVFDPAHPRATYAGSKVIGEQLVRFKCLQAGIPFVIVRFHNVYGPRMGYVHVVPEIIKRVMSGEDPLRLFGKGQTRAFCYIDDAIRAIKTCMEKIENEVVHVGTDEETEISDLYSVILKELGRQPKLDPAPPASGSVERRCPDIGKLRRLIQYNPEVSLAEGVRRTCEWYVNDLDQHGSWE
jgi:UDP-glucose 4-epimerase/UDP-glucuronate decarboxylase